MTTHHCTFRPYGEVEKVCTKCNYVIWVNKNKTDYEIIDDMVKAKYPLPSCSKP